MGWNVWSDGWDADHRRMLFYDVVSLPSMTSGGRGVMSATCLRILFAVLGELRWSLMARVVYSPSPMCDRIGVFLDDWVVPCRAGEVVIGWY